MYRVVHERNLQQLSLCPALWRYALQSKPDYQKVIIFSTYSSHNAKQKQKIRWRNYITNQATRKISTNTNECIEEWNVTHLRYLGSRKAAFHILGLAWEVQMLWLEGCWGLASTHGTWAHALSCMVPVSLFLQPSSASFSTLLEITHQKIRINF